MNEQENNDNGIITDINKAREKKGEEPKEEGQNENPLTGQEAPEYEVDADDEMEEQVADLHGKIFMRVMNKIQLSGSKVGREDVQVIAQTINKVMEQKMLYAIMEELGIDNVEDIIGEEDQDEIVNIFNIKKDLSVSKEDLENLDIDQ